MTDYNLYASSCGIMQKDMVRVIQEDYPRFTKAYMSFASNPQRNAIQLIPDAEKKLVSAFGPGPGLSISKSAKKRSHSNRHKPNRLYVRLDDSLMARVQSLYEKMCFVSMQDLLEAAISEFVEKREK